MTGQRPSCLVQAAGSIELYFYDELPEAGRLEVRQHLAGCRACRQSLDDLMLIRTALAARPAVWAPPAGDWSRFMARLDTAMGGPAPRARRSRVPMLAMAALLALVTIGVLLAARSHITPIEPDVADAQPLNRSEPRDRNGDTAGLAAVGQRHLERSKLVLLGLANKDADRTASAEWHYERELASRLLTDTRLYRIAAEDRGLTGLADVMRDLEFVLLQTSMTAGRDASELSQIQRAIRKRDLLQKMDVVRTTGL